MDNDIDDDGHEESPEVALKEQQAQIEREKQALLHNENIVAEVRPVIAVRGN